MYSAECLQVTNIIFKILQQIMLKTYTLKPLYNTAHYNMVLDIARLKVGSQKFIDYIEK